MNLGNSTKSKKYIIKKEVLSLQSTAELLNVSPATIRNWMKAGKLKPCPTSKDISFSHEEVLKLKKEIESGASSRLKSRRNKKAITGKIVPTDYVQSKEYIKIATEIVEQLQKPNLHNHILMRLILVEVAINLFFKSSPADSLTNSPPKMIPESAWQPVPSVSHTELLLEKKLDLGEFNCLINELIDSDLDTHLHKDKESVIEKSIGLDKDKNINKHKYLNKDLDKYKGKGKEIEVLNIPEYLHLLRSISQLNIPYIQGDDLLGLLYMSLSNLGSRKRKGSYYTPGPIVEQMVERTLAEFKDQAFPQILDPCCGSGNFLIKMFMKITDVAGKSGILPAELEESTLKNLSGYDIDPIAVVLTKINLFLMLTNRNSQSLELLNKNIQTKNVLLSLASKSDQTNTTNTYTTNTDTTKTDTIYPLQHTYKTLNNTERKYDIVIGNPPWGYSFTQEDITLYKKYYFSGQSALESFSLFIEAGLSFLKDKGILAYVLPESLLNVDIHRNIRHLILNKTNIIEINFLGNSFANVNTPTITIMLQVPKTSDTSHKIHIKRGINQHFVTQERLQKNIMQVFNIHITDEENDLLQHLQSIPGVLFLKNNADFALGIVTGNNSELVLANPIKGAEPILKGNDISKYSYSSQSNYIIYKPENFQQVAPTELYRAEEKLIYRFINNSLVFAYDNKQRLTLNSANIVIPRLPGYSIKYILAVLNSRTAQFFHSGTFSSVKVLRKHIESIPIPPCSPSAQNRIIQLVDQLLDLPIQPEKEQEKVISSARLSLYEEIDKEIMELFGLNSNQKRIIISQYPHIKYL